MSFSVIFAGLLIILGHAFKVLCNKTKIPDVIPMVLVGLLMGPVFGFLMPEKFGIMGDLLGSLSLSIILFYSGLEINLETANKSLWTGTNLACLNFAITTIIVAACAMLLLKLSVIEALGVGAILGGTSFAIVIPMVSSMQLSDKSKTILLLESTFSDVFCIVVSLGIFQMIHLREMNPGFMAGQILSSFVMSSLIGSFAALFWATALRWVRKLENDMLLTPAFIITIFGLTEFLGYSGAISSLAFGVVSGNITRFASYPVISRFTKNNIMKFNSVELSLFSELVFVLKTFFFFYIGLSIEMTSIAMVAAGFLLVFLISIGRIASTKISLGNTLSSLDRMAITIMSPKGLVSVILLSLAAKVGYSNMPLVQELVYSTILASIVFSASMSFALEKGSLSALSFKIFPERDLTAEPAAALPTETKLP